MCPLAMLKQEDKYTGTPLGHFDTQYVLKKNDMGLVPLFWVGARSCSARLPWLLYGSSLSLQLLKPKMR